MDTPTGLFEPTAAFDCANATDSLGAHPSVPTRGVAWVLRWAVALVVLYFSSCVLAEFVYCLAAEHELARAARAGALEATLPRATCQSVRAVAGRRLTNYRHGAERFQLAIWQNGSPVRAKLQPQPGDRMSVSIATTARAVTPRWLQALKFWGDREQILVAAERRMPGRALARIRR